MAKLSIPIVKSKGVIEVDTELLPEDVYKEALIQGLKVLANRGMSKITKAALPNEEEFKAEAQVAAETNLKKLYSGDIKLSGAKAKKASGAVMTEVRRLAKNLVKDEIKKAGLKIAHYPASEITKAANAIIDAEDANAEDSLFAVAKKNLEEREKTPVKIDVKKLLVESPKLVAAVEAAKVAKKAKGGTISAKQAGKVAPRAKGGKVAPAAQPSV